MGLPHYWLCVNSPGEVLGDVYAEELDAADPLHWSPVDGDGGVLTGPPPEIHHQLLGLTDVQREVVVATPVSQGVLLFFVGWFIVIGDQTNHRCVIHKFDDGVGQADVCNDITGHQCQACICHARRFFSTSLVNENIHYDVDENLWLNPQDRVD